LESFLIVALEIAEYNFETFVINGFNMVLIILKSSLIEYGRAIGKGILELT
jgi:hypothetical protein